MQKLSHVEIRNTEGCIRFSYPFAEWQSRWPWWCRRRGRPSSRCKSRPQTSYPWTASAIEMTGENSNQIVIIHTEKWIRIRIFSSRPASECECRCRPGWRACRWRRWCGCPRGSHPGSDPPPWSPWNRKSGTVWNPIYTDQFLSGSKAQNVVE